MVYLLDARGQLVGPFKDREGVDRFVKMMALCGEDWADNKIVEGGGDDVTEQNPEFDSCASPLKGSIRLRFVGRRL